jgi:uncharacterized membrane protein YqhA
VKLLQRLEVLFERTLWGSRLLILVAVVGSILMAVGAVYMATVDVFMFLGHLGTYADLTHSVEFRKDLRAQTITMLIKAVDGYLIASMLLIFAFGLYQLFISKLEIGETATAVPPLPPS